MSRRAKIVCTLGPASDDRETIEALAEAGMSIARFNASHGSPADRRELAERVRAVDATVETPLAVMLDLPGPEIRTVEMPEPVNLTGGDTVEFVEGGETTTDRIGLTTSIDAVELGDKILLDDGRIAATVTETNGTVKARLESGGELTSRTGVNIPGVDLGLPAVTDQDRRELDVAADSPVDFIAASFVSSAEDVYEVGAELDERDLELPIIAKIERAEAVENIEEIIAAADGIMVARGDLGVECPLEDVPIIQKRTIRRCHNAGVPVITATEMLDSMIHEHRPTRAEASDVANAVLDGTDAVMLSGETAIGDHPVSVVETMARIVADIEASEEYDESLEQRVPPAGDARTDALARSARFLARDIGATAIVAASESGYTARKAAKYRPNIPIVASTPNDQVRRELALSWGITSRHTNYEESPDSVIRSAVQAALDAGVAESGDTVVVLAGMMTDYDDYNTTDMLKVHVASDRLVSGKSVVSGFVTGPLYRAPDGDMTEIPEGSIVAVPESLDAEFQGDLSKIAGLVDAHRGMTGYAAVVARELGVPMISDATVPERIEDGREVTLDGERGVVYADPVSHNED